jgi:antitoxin (DNA-binding transcriptional repressor) of toxin-antitoxin stability system
MPLSVSKSGFKAKALELFRQIERTGKPIIITDRGTPVLKVTRYRDHSKASLRVLRKSVMKYDAPIRPVSDHDWESGA